MKTPTLLVERPDGTRLLRNVDEIRDDDLVLLDAPGAYGEADAAQRAFDEEIDAAGGFEEWKALHRQG
ncbi:MAG: hypothetical protein AB1430_09180 [Pseudomonadota bacterium]